MVGVVKNTLNFKRERNGLFLKVHHTKQANSGEKTKIRFILLDIAKSIEAFAVVDESDNIFIFHLIDKCFWQLPDVKIQKCTAIKFVPQQSNNLLIGNKYGFIYENEINEGTTLRCIKAFSIPINQLLFPSNDTKTFVASSSNQIKIYDLDSLVKRCEFTARDDAKIKSVNIIPHDDRLLVLLNNDIICILTAALKLIRRFDPLKARQKYLLKSNQKMEKLNYIRQPENDDEMSADVDKLIKSVTRDYRNGIVTDVSLSPNGSSLCVCFLDNFIIICSISMWDVRRVMKFPDEIYIKRSVFIPTTHEQNSSMLLTSTSNDNLMLMSLKDLNSKLLIDMNNSVAFGLSSNGKVLMNIQQSGEIFVHNFEHCLNAVDAVDDNDLKKCGNSMMDNDVKRIKSDDNDGTELDEIQTKLNKTMPIGRLLPILKEFGEYPEKYRAMIWKTILKLPQDHCSFARFMKQGPHSCVESFSKKYSLVDQKALNSLSLIVSCLAHWTPVFGYVEYLPKFVFPFLKIFKGDLLLSFELIATLMNNHCQLWLEFAPLQMPYNYLCLIENILMENDRKLYEFYKSKNISPKIYAMPLMESAFSEVFDEQQWLQLWDHIVSNDAYFMIFIIVAYNSILRMTIMRCDADGVQKIFMEQNYVNFKKLTSKAYRMMEKCSSSIHPKLYMKPYVALTRGGYQKFENYPKNLSDMKVNEIDALRKEQKILDKKLTEMASLEKTINVRMERHLMDEEYGKRMREVEATYEKALGEEEERIVYQRKMLLLSTKKIRERENEMLIRGKNCLLRKRVEASENELELMLRNLDKQRTREEIELQIAEENLKLKEMSMEMKNYDMENSSKQEPLKMRYKSSIEEIANQKHRFQLQLHELKSSPRSSSSIINSTTSQQHSEEEAHSLETRFPSQVSALESTFEKIQNDYILSVGSEKSEEDYNNKMKQLEKASVDLESEIHKLIDGIAG